MAAPRHLVKKYYGKIYSRTRSSSLFGISIFEDTEVLLPSTAKLFSGNYPNLEVLRNTSDDMISELEGWVKVTIPNGQNNIQFIKRLIQAANQYGERQHAPYYFNPSLDPNNTYNSNSFVSGVIRHAGGTPPDLKLGSLQTPGYGRSLPIPFSHPGCHIER